MVVSCPSGWVTTGDFATDPASTECDQNLAVIRGLGIACASANLICLCYMARVLAFRARHTETKLFLLGRFFLITAPGHWMLPVFLIHKYVDKTSNDFWMPNNDHKTTAPAAFLLSSLCLCLYGLLKAVSPGEFGVGLDWTATVFAALGISLSLFGMDLNTGILLKFVLKKLRTSRSESFLKFVAAAELRINK